MVIDQGNRFKGLWSNIGFVIVLGCLGGFIRWNRDAFQAASLLLLPLAIVGGELLRNRRGIELDKETSQARAYVQTFGFKRGKWIPLEGFSRVILVKDYYLLNVGPSTVPFLRGRKKRVASFDVLLSGNTGNELFLTESTTHQEAKRHLKSVSEYLGLPSEDRLQATIDQLQRRRKSMGRR